MLQVFFIADTVAQEISKTPVSEQMIESVIDKTHDDQIKQTCLYKPRNSKGQGSQNKHMGKHKLVTLIEHVHTHARGTCSDGKLFTHMLYIVHTGCFCQRQSSSMLT